MVCTSIPDLPSTENSHDWLELPPKLTASILVRLGDILFKVEEMTRKALDLSAGQLKEFSINYFATEDLLLYVTNRDINSFDYGDCSGGCDIDDYCDYGDYSGGSDIDSPRSNYMDSD
ncbi:hypothetical protein POM88_019731 [Heracleum sosnowskyi]|uniref:Uncharacterized protein n=1 Tax=Heracleum sosnowskyi TaxID=360622 RepID=A0AAD8IAH0_9APIA|nr:hypothetical protein POM88_019731 [Heracleum sosnowskyi]